MRTLVFALLLVMSAHASASSAEIKCVRGYEPSRTGLFDDLNNCNWIQIAGKIESGDAQRFSELLARNEWKVEGVDIVSPGGLVYEAIEIGRTVRENGLVTRTAFHTDLQDGRRFAGFFPIGTDPRKESQCGGVENYACACISACFFVWSGGIQREGSLIGLHRPRNDEYFRGTTSGDAGEEYDRILLAITDYLREMDVNSRFLDYIKHTPSSDVRFLSAEESEMFLEGYIPPIAEWLAANCGRIGRDDYNAFYRLVSERGSGKTLSVLEEKFIDNISLMENEIGRCERRMLAEERQKRWAAD